MSRTDRREALLARFRSGSLTRIADVLAKLETSAPLTAEQLSELHAPLHTLKGEARMLGLGSLAALVHEVEGRLAEASREQPSLDRVHAAVALIQERLHAPLLDDREAEQALERGRALLGTAASEPRVGPTPAPVGPLPDASVNASASTSTDPDESSESTAPARRREPVFSTIRAELLDELCERIEALRVGLGRANAAGKPSAGRDDAVRQELAELAELAWGLRLVPVEPALENLSEHASELAAQLGKPVRVRIDAGGAALERSLLERLQEPLMHMVHNAIDHGIEPRGERVNKPTVARVEIIARSVGPEVEVTVLDDGRGVDLERVRRRAHERGLLDEAAAATAGPDELFGLLFESGFSTSATVSELSGRGVGLDAVRRAVESLGGEVAVSSEPGRGARFSLRVPATISRETVIVIELGGTLWGLPSRRVGPVVALAKEGGKDLGRAPTITVDGKYVPVLSLARLLGLGVEVESRVAICCSHAGRRYALASPKVLGEFELFRRPMGPVLSSIGLATASAVMDDGRLVLLLEPTTLLGQRLRRDSRDLRPVAIKTRARVLVVDDSPIIRDLLVELLTAAKLDVHTAADGAEALEVLDRHRVDLVLSDVEMPGIDGFELLTRVRQRDPDLPVVMVTTRGSVADRERAAALGANAYLVKSEFRDRDMLDAIARFVEVAR
jgi:two-component system chemotaxis sensor kinase CheA